MRTRAVIVLVMLCAGCTVATRGSLTASPDPWPPRAREGSLPSISLVIERIAEGQGGVGTTFQKWRDDTLRAYRESGYFSEVVAGLQAKDLRADIVIRSKGGPSHANVLLAGFTFGLIPVVETQQLEVRTSIRRADGAPISSENSGTVRVWMQILLLPVSPFSPKAATLADAVVYDLNRATLLQMQDQLVSNGKTADSVKMPAAGGGGRE